MTPRVSVIIPAYNTEKYVDQSIKSALEQTVKNIEVIVVDDGSTDATQEIIKSFSDNRIRLIVNDCNRGLRYSLNRAIREAKGEWIALLDSDDWYTSPIRLEKLLQIADEYNADLVADNQYFIREDEKKPYSTLFSVGEPFEQPKKVDPVTFIESNMKPAAKSPHLGLLKPLIKQDFLVKHDLRYDESFRSKGDLHFYMMCLLSGAQLFIVPEPYYCYRYGRRGSISKRSKLSGREQLRNIVVNLLSQKSAQKDPDLVDSLSRFLSIIERDINYYRVVEIIKEHGIIASIVRMFRDPHFSRLFLRQIPEILRRRIGLSQV